ncbi:MAG: hypothetical protein WCS70_13560 [Verrucomicrobiota bacterium]
MKKMIGLCLLTAGLAFAADETVELKGKLGCGHCNYHKATSCAAAFKTADGKIYIIDNATKEVMDARTKGGSIAVTGTVSDKDGVAHVQATKQELTK